MPVESELVKAFGEIAELSQKIANLESLIQELSSRLEQLEQTKQTKAFRVSDLDRSE